jgi:hypothetical protein
VLVLVPALLGLAAAQPALRSHNGLRIRTDAQAFYVLDTSRSMLAARAPGAPTRLARAKAEAIAIREALPEIPSGVATFTDRVLPDLLPDADPAVFVSTVRRAVAIGEPPPAEDSVVATWLAAIGALGTQNYFPPSATRRLAILFTDGESRPFNPSAVAHDLAQGPGVRLLMVHVWAPGEAVYDRRVREQGYHENPESEAMLESIAAASGGKVFQAGSISAVVRAANAFFGKGPTVIQGESERTRTLAPYVVLVALIVLLGFLVPRLARRQRREAAVPTPDGPRATM